jgi:hypothetical protein
LDLWGRNSYRSVNDLFNEVEREETHLELWGRKDGVPLLMRVVHVIQTIVSAKDKPQLAGKHLLQIWQSTPEGQVRTVHRLLAKKLSTRVLPFDEERFGKAAREAVKEQLQCGADAVSIANLERCTTKDDALRSTPYSVVIGDNISFMDQRYDIEESPTFKGMHTMYHLYTVQVEVSGLPDKDFTSLDFDRAKTTGKDKPHSQGWRWVSWMQAMDLVHAQVQGLQRRDTQRMKKAAQSLSNLEELRASLDNGSKNEETMRLLAALTADLTDMQAQSTHNADITAMLPPSMVSQLSESARMDASSLMSSECALEDGRRASLNQKRQHNGTTSPRLSSDSDLPAPSRSAYLAGQGIYSIFHEELADRPIDDSLPPTIEGERCRSWSWSPWCGCTTAQSTEDEMFADKAKERRQL